MTPVIHLSLTDDHPYAQAFVIIEAVAAVIGFGLSRTVAGGAANDQGR
jgi:hypothetical protein